MSDGYFLTGEVQTRCWDFIRIRALVDMEIRTQGNMGRRGYQAARRKYVPRELISRGNIIDRSRAARFYMTYVVTLLTAGGLAKTYGEDIVMGRLVFAGLDDKCGCPTFTASPDKENRLELQAPDVAVMCIGHEEMGS